MIKGLKIMVLLAATVLVFALVLMQGFSMRERSVSVEGDFSYIRNDVITNEVQRISRQQPENDLFVQEVRRVLEGFDYISHVAVRHKWPNHVVLNIRESSPFILINDDLLMAHDCQVISRGGHDFSNGFIAISVMQEDVDGLNCDDLKKLVSLVGSVDGVSNIRIEKNGDIVLKVSGVDFYVSANQMESSLQQLKNIMTHFSAELVTIGSIDMRYYGGIAVAPKEVL